MRNISFLFLLFALILGFSSHLNAQNENIHFAFFVDTETNVYKDLNNRLIMNFTISSVIDQADLDNITYKFEHYGIFENVQITPTTDNGVYAVYTISKPDVRVKDQRKLFVSCGIYTLFIDDQPYPTENFTVQMMNEN